MRRKGQGLGDGWRLFSLDGHENGVLEAAALKRVARASAIASTAHRGLSRQPRTGHFMRPVAGGRRRANTRLLRIAV